MRWIGLGEKSAFIILGGKSIVGVNHLFSIIIIEVKWLCLRWYQITVYVVKIAFSSRPIRNVLPFPLDTDS